MPELNLRVCPLLGGSGIADPPLLQPDAGNRCALADVDAPPRRDLQARYCLGGRHALCPALAARTRDVHAAGGTTAGQAFCDEESPPSQAEPVLADRPGIPRSAASARNDMGGDIFRTVPHAAGGATANEKGSEGPSAGRQDRPRTGVRAGGAIFRTALWLAVLAILALLLVLSSLAWYSWRRSLASSSGVVSAVTLAPETPTGLALTLTPTVGEVTPQATPSPTPSSTPSPAPESTPSPTPSATATPSPPVPTPMATAAVAEPMITVEATTEISFVALGALSRTELDLPTPTRSAPRNARQGQDEGELWDMHLKQPSRLAATHPPDRIVAESIGLDAPVVPVGQKVVDVDGQATALWEVAEYAAGWHKGSALPGRVGNIVLSGHHNIKGEVFRHLEHLQEGDKIVLYADGRPYRYVVQLKMIVKEKGEPLAVREENARWIGPFPDERLTLVACWPYTSNTHRVIVVARPADVSLPLERPIPPAGPPPSPSFAD